MLIIRLKDVFSGSRIFEIAKSVKCPSPVNANELKSVISKASASGLSLIHIFANEGGMKKKDVFKEFISSLITACFLGAITFIISFLFVYILGLGLPEGASELGRLETAVIFAVIIGGSLTIIVSAVSLLAMGIPHLLKKLKIDPAIASGPFITTLIDLFEMCIRDRELTN